MRRPVVDVPVVFVEEGVILGHLLARHRGQVLVCEGGEEEVCFEDPAFAALVWGAGG